MLLVCLELSSHIVCTLSSLVWDKPSSPLRITPLKQRLQPKWDGDQRTSLKMHATRRKSPFSNSHKSIFFPPFSPIAFQSREMSEVTSNWALPFKVGQTRAALELCVNNSTWCFSLKVLAPNTTNYFGALTRHGLKGPECTDVRVSDT